MNENFPSKQTPDRWCVITAWATVALLTFRTMAEHVSRSTLEEWCALTGWQEAEVRRAIWFCLHESPQQHDVIMSASWMKQLYTQSVSHSSCLNLPVCLFFNNGHSKSKQFINLLMEHKKSNQTTHTHTHTSWVHSSGLNFNLVSSWQQHPALFRQTNISLHAFKHTPSWIFWSGLTERMVRTLLRGHPWGHRGANQVLAWGSLVIMMQGHSSHYNSLSQDSMTQTTAWLLIPYSFMLFMAWSLV